MIETYNATHNTITRAQYDKIDLKDHAIYNAILSNILVTIYASYAISSQEVSNDILLVFLCMKIFEIPIFLSYRDFFFSKNKQRIRQYQFLYNNRHRIYLRIQNLKNQFFIKNSQSIVIIEKIFSLNKKQGVLIIYKLGTRHVFNILVFDFRS